MDILKDFKYFFNGGLDCTIQEFRSINDEDAFVFNARYLEDIDAVEWVDPDDDTVHEGIKLNFFSQKLEREMFLIKNGVEEKLVNLQSIAKKDSNFIAATFQKSNIDFPTLRRNIIANTGWVMYQDSLLSFVTAIEASLVRHSKGIIKQEIIEIPENTTPKVISFGFNGKEEQLKKLYFELNLESGSFVDIQKTTFQQFKSILTSKDVLCEDGKIHFDCETKQACYIIRLMDNLFENLKFQLIGESKKFITKGKGVPLLGNTISRNKSSNLKQKVFIDKFFLSLQKM